MSAGAESGQPGGVQAWENVAQPRRVYLLGTPDYVPAPAAPHRVGALDFVDCPSLRGARTVPFQTQGATRTGGNAINSDVRAIWLTLRRDGGWWSVASLTRHWSPTYAPFEVQQALDALEAGAFIVSRDQARNLTYAFTSECSLLPDALPPPQPGALA